MELTLFSNRYISTIILPCKTYAFGTQNNRFYNALIIRLLCDRYACEKYLHNFRYLSTCSIRNIVVF
ncbi:hypothetical protein CLI69_07505 [Prevotella intermedia]|nr:hypothetical protein CLI69_07505 [Prevotella intermedia]